MEADNTEQKPHAESPARKEDKNFAPSRLCVRLFCSAPFICCFALLIRAGTLLLMSNGLQNDPDAYWRLAENLVEHGTFGQNDVPTAYRPPVYPLVLTGCVACGEYGRVAVGVLHLLLGVATVGMVLVLGRCWGLGRCAAAAAALLVACDPILLAGSAQVMTETLATFLATAGLLALTWSQPEERSVSIAGSQRLPERAMIAGIVLALAALCRPAFLLWVVAAAAVLWWQNRRIHSTLNQNSRGPTAPGRIVPKLCLPWTFILGALLVLSPWAIRNQIQFGRPTLTTTHGGYTLLLANNPEFYQWLREGTWGSVWQADRFNADWNQRRPRNELQADRLAYADAWRAIRQDPSAFCHACVVRVARFWSPLPHQLSADETPLRRLSRYAVALWYIAEFALAIIGLLRLCKSSRLPLSPSAFPLSFHAWFYGVLLIGCLMVSHVVYWTDMRMRAPVMPVVAIIAVGGFFCRSQTSLDENKANH